MGAFAQSAKEVRGASPYVAVENEPSPKLIVDPPLPEGLAQGVFWAQYRWLAAHYPQVPFERYADDVIAHCRM